MSTPTDPADIARWLELATKERKGADPSDLVWQTPEGIEVKPLYTRADVENLDFTDTIPGAYPFMRGPRATMYAERARGRSASTPASPPPRSRTPSTARTSPPASMGLSVAFDLATHRGYDSGPSARDGRRRQGRRRDRLRRGHEDPLRRHPARPDVGVDDDERRRAAGPRELHRRGRGAGGPPGEARRDHPERHPQGVHGPQHLHLPARRPRCGSSPTSSSTRRKNMPKFNSISISGYHMQEAGATCGPGARLHHRRRTRLRARGALQGARRRRLRRAPLLLLVASG